MMEVSVSDLRRRLPEYLSRVARGAALKVSRRGRVIAMVMSPADVRTGARETLARLRRRAVIGDVVSPVDARWNADDRP